MKRLGFAVLAALALLSATPAMSKSGPFAKESIPSRSGRKFLRGVNNVLFFWAEVPKEINRDWQNVDPMTGIFSGTGKGIYKGALRLGSGVYEIVTFPLDSPANYQPLVYPETVLEDGYDWNAEEYHARDRASKLKY